MVQRVVFTAHARDRMAQRGIPIDNVMAALHDHDISIPDPANRSRKYQKRFGDQVLVVCVKDPPRGIMLVKTVFYQGDEEA